MVSSSNQYNLYKVKLKLQVQTEISTESTNWN